MKKILKTVSLLGLLTIVGVSTGCTTYKTPSAKPFKSKVKDVGKFSDEQKIKILNKSIREGAPIAFKNNDVRLELSPSNCLIWSSERGWENMTNCYNLVGDEIVLSQKRECIYTDRTPRECGYPERMDEDSLRRYVKFVDIISQHVATAYDKNIEQEKIAAAKRAEQEKIAAAKKVEKEIETQERLNAMGYLGFDGMRERIDLIDEFGNKTKKTICKIEKEFDKNVNKDYRRELLVLYSQIFKLDPSRIEQIKYLFSQKENAELEEYAALTITIPIYQNKGFLPSKIVVNTNNLQLKKGAVSIDRNINHIASSLNGYLKSDSKNTSLSRLKVLYSYFISAKLIRELPLDEEKCNLEGGPVFAEPTVFFARAFDKEETKVNALKLLYSLEEKTPGETTKLLLSFPRVKEFYNFIENY